MKKMAAISSLGLVLLAGAILMFGSLQAFALDEPPGGKPTTTSTGTSTPGGGSIEIQLPNPLKCDDAVCLRDSLIKAAQVIGWYVVTIMILWGAFQILTAGGSPEKLEQGRRTIFYAIIGFVILLLAASVVYVVQSMLNAAAK